MGISSHVPTQRASNCKHPPCRITIGMACSTLVSPAPLYCFGVGKSYSLILRQLHVSLVSNDDCSREHGSRFNTKTMGCARIAGDPKDNVCTGDSGAILQCEYPGTGQWVLAGMRVWDEECHTNDKPVLYTRVAAFHWMCEGRLYLTCCVLSTCLTLKNA